MNAITQESAIINDEYSDLDFPKRITLQKTFPVEFFDGIKKYIYIEEIGDNDITVITDADITYGDSFQMKLFFNGDSGILTVFTDSKSHVLNRFKRFVLSYDTVSPEAGIILANIASSWQVKTNAKFVTPNSTFTIQIFDPDIGDWQCFYMFIISLSHKGIEYSSEISFPEHEFILRLYISEEQLPVQTIANFLFEKEISMGHKKGWLEFIDISEENKEIIAKYIEKFVQGSITSVTPAPIEMF